MFESRVKRLIEATGAKLLCGDPESRFVGFAIDSREITPACAFIAFVGERVNGNDYVDAALDAGAALAIMSAEPTAETQEHARACGAALVRAADDDCEELLLRLAADWRQRNPQWLVVGVTGSVGKTTTKDMLAAAARSQWKTHATVGNYNSVIGMPLTILDAKDTDELLVLEMGMNHAGELERISRAARPDVAIITNIGSSHIGLLGSRKNIARAKAEILSGMTPLSQSSADSSARRAQLVLSSADDFSSFIAHELASPRGIATAFVGTHEGDDYRLSQLTVDDEGCASFVLRTKDGTQLDVYCPIRGKAAAHDLALALAALDCLGADMSQALKAVQSLEAVPMRVELLQAASGFRILDDSYNASPASMAAALDVLCEIKHQGRRIALLGEMGELGDDAPRLHDLVGSYAAAKPIDLFVFVGGPNASRMCEAAKTMGRDDTELVCVADVEEALSFLSPQLGAQDLILVKASRAVGLDRFVREVLGDARKS